jgi:hypothetical protein
MEFRAPFSMDKSSSLSSKKEGGSSGPTVLVATDSIFSGCAADEDLTSEVAETLDSIER